ncbi:MAG TPA: GDSL-type esterase/lipase family protein, partial [Ferruginibacter sp.]|nr:GDSL-type esterase/lipase family protein [Ferruginibacter sp.]
MKKIIVSSCFILLPLANLLHADPGNGSVNKSVRHNVPLQFGNQIMNPDGLQPLRSKMRKADSTLSMIKVLHIGDSHIKAGVLSQHFMERLNAFYAQRYHGNLFFNFQVFCKIGTKYSDYNELAELDSQLTRDQPDLVIISLGTNDAFSGSSRTNFYEKIDHLVTKIKTLSPQAVVLLTTPSDALKKDATTGVFTALPDLVNVVNTIIKYANDHNIAYWNLHEVMGGTYSINSWFQKKMAE